MGREGIRKGGVGRDCGRVTKEGSRKFGRREGKGKEGTRRESKGEISPPPTVISKSRRL